MNSRFCAAGLHLLCSVSLGIATLGIVYLVWYPFPLAAATGVGGVFFILLAVDLALGPLLTLLVYRKEKKGLVFDLSVIAILQAGAFFYGVHAIAVARPAWIVFNVDRFDLVQANEVDARFLADSDAKFRHASWTGPFLVGSRAPLDPQRRNQLILESSLGGADLPQRLDLYVPIEQEAENIKDKAHSLKELARYNKLDTLQAVLAKWPEADSWLPLMAKVQPVTVLVSKRNGAVVSIVDLRPWN